MNMTLSVESSDDVMIMLVCGGGGDVYVMEYSSHYHQLVFD